MAESQYRTIAGVVQFPPREGQAGGKDVRNIAVRTAGVKEQSIRVSATLWPSHEHIEVGEGDFVVLEGKFSQNKGTNQQGDSVTYNNLSVTGILVLGALDSGQEVETVNTESGDEPADDDIPF